MAKKKDETVVVETDGKAKPLFELAADMAEFLGKWEDGQIRTMEELDAGIRIEDDTERKIIDTAKFIKNCKHDEEILKAQSDVWRERCNEHVKRRKGLESRGSGCREYLAFWMEKLGKKTVDALDIRVTLADETEEVVIEDPKKVPAKYHVTHARVIDQAAFDAWAQEAFQEAQVLPPGLILDDSQIDTSAILKDFLGGPDDVKGIVPDGVRKIYQPHHIVIT